MNKPVVFFSHSGRDKNMLLPIKEKVNTATCNTLNIFMSSDGQSIPFGKNWIAQVENGLQEAKLMFVFITPASLESGWIYFETGFAYAKGIKVVPIGIGVSIGSLKPPINMLQGFDITSGESLNNILTIINREFDCQFNPCFAEDDYLSLFEETAQGSSLVYRVFSDINSTIIKEENNQATQMLRKIKDKIAQHGIPCSVSDTLVLAGGMRAEIAEVILSKWSYGNKVKDYYLELSLSTHNFIESFDMVRLIADDLNQKMLWLRCALYGNYDLLEKPEDFSAIISKYPSLFSYSELSPYTICYKGKIQIRLVSEDDEHIHSQTTEIRIGFDIANTTGADIAEVVSALIDTGIITEE